MNNTKISIVFIATIIAVIVVGGTMYLLQWSASQNAPQGQSNNLQNQTNEPTDKQKELTQSDKGKYIKVIYPNGGEEICLNDDVLIEWESEGIDTVSVKLTIQQYGSKRNFYPKGLGAVPAIASPTVVPKQGLINWKVEPTEDLTLGGGYKIEIFDNNSEDIYIADESDGFFSIVRCDG